MKILVACEESQAVTIELRKLGHEAYSCDLLPCSGGHPEWHRQQDCFEVLAEQKWDMLIAFPPCTYLSVSGAQWYYDPKDKSKPHPKYPNRAQDREDAKNFFKALLNADVPRIAIENPVGIMNSEIKPSQIIQPYQFGDEATKTTCLWLKGLPLLIPTEIVGKGSRTVFASGKSHPTWYAEALRMAKTPAERRTLRSKTFPGIAKAMATQWTR